MHSDVNPKKFLGQHFLIDDNISKKIVETINFKKFKKVIEIGPGKGALTKHLLHIKDILTLIEIDKERSVDVIITRLRKKIEESPKTPKFLQTIRGAGYVLWIK